MKKLLLRTLLSLFVSLATAAAQSGNAFYFGTLAGLGPGKAEGQGAAARFQNPRSVARDNSGNIYVADSPNHVIRRITPGGLVSTFAGLNGVPGYLDGERTSARFTYPSAIVFDSAGTLWVADAGNEAIRKITTDGIVSTFVGGTVGTGGALEFLELHGIAVDAAGNIYVTDFQTVRKVTPAGVITTLAGQAGFDGFTDGPGGQALFSDPSGIVVDPDGFILVADAGNGAIRVVSPDGFARTYSYIWYGEGTPYYLPTGIALDAARNVYVADAGNNLIRKITDGNVTTLAGSDLPPYYGSADGPGSAARFDGPTGLALDGAGNIYVADALNATIRKIDAALNVSTIAGLASPGSNDGPLAAARFAKPYGVAIDGAGNLYVADTNNYTVRKISTGGVVTTVAGMAGQFGSADGNGSAARFSDLRGIAVDGAGNLYVADTNNSSVRKITPAGDVSTLAMLTYFTSSGERYGNPEGVTVDGAGNVYAAATAISAIFKITPAGAVSLFAGVPGSNGHFDGNRLSARFNRPSGITVDNGGNIYVADTFGNCIRKITPAGFVSTLPGDLAYRTRGVTVDGVGNVFFTVSFDCTVRKVAPDGTVDTVAGLVGAQQSADGLGSVARFWTLSGIVADQKGNIFVADTNNNTIRVGRVPPSAPNVVMLQNRHMFVGGKANALASVDITASTTVGGEFAIIGTVTADGSGSYGFEDSNSDSFPKRFYRASLHLPSANQEPPAEFTREK